ncbi:hypothetical protein BDY19DRAFT_521918 [Irpex rosettiformis]|uniref:Uncharacterized protein n=1 Tax=Irpex rosettiformis TaxID=378272 RepID=A0ACB8TRL1_9APHY|nr:hypothetical protein BDY19DRAFT_521918 [Irpex rosettiformis]
MYRDDLLSPFPSSLFLLLRATTIRYTNLVSMQRISRCSSVRGPRNPSGSTTAQSNRPPRRPPHGPIERLPAEVLGVIFEALVASLYQDPSLDVSNDASTYVIQGIPVYSWVRITQVCRSWRAIALDSSSLWTRIHVGLLKNERAMLYHSQHSLLTVRCISPSYRQDLRSQFAYILSDIVGQAERIGRLELKVDKFIADNPWNPLFGTTRAPSLYSLRIDSDDKYQYRTPCVGWSMPNLRSLDIRAPLTESWRPFLCRSLRHLSLESFTGTQHVGAKSLPLLDVLAELPLLRSLVLRLDTYSGKLESRSVDRTALPQLRLLEVSGHLGHCINVLDHLTIPDAATIILDSSKNCFHRVCCPQTANYLALASRQRYH